jgi:hypothetical protein
VAKHKSTGSVTRNTRRPNHRKLTVTARAKQSGGFPRLKDGHIWDTKRLRVYLQTITTPDGLTSFVFTGWRLDVVWPRSAVTATVGSPNTMSVPGKTTAPLWWLFTDDECRRKGFAMELLQSINTNWLPVYVWGATSSGEKFSKAFYRRLDTAK